MESSSSAGEEDIGQLPGGHLQGDVGTMLDEDKKIEIDLFKQQEVILNKLELYGTSCLSKTQHKPQEENQTAETQEVRKEPAKKRSRKGGQLRRVVDNMWDEVNKIEMEILKLQEIISKKLELRGASCLSEMQHMRREEKPTAEIQEVRKEPPKKRPRKDKKKMEPLKKLRKVLAKKRAKTGGQLQGAVDTIWDQVNRIEMEVLKLQKVILKKLELYGIPYSSYSQRKPRKAKQTAETQEVRKEPAKKRPTKGKREMDRLKELRRFLARRRFKRALLRSYNEAGPSP